MSLEARTIKRITEITAIPAEQITPESELVTHLGCDSLDILEIIMALEEEFECNINDDEAMELKTVQQVIDHMRKITEGVAA